MLDANRLAHELHRRRSSISSGARRCQAAGEAKFCAMYGFMPSLNDFDSYMDLNLALDDGKVLGVVTNPQSSYEIVQQAIFRVDIFVFTSGEKLSDCKVIGWLPSERVLQAPVASTKKLNRIIDGRCVYPMPPAKTLGDLVFEEPVLDSLGVWDYELQALWTPEGYHVYSDVHKFGVQEVDTMERT